MADSIDFKELALMTKTPRPSSGRRRRMTLEAGEDLPRTPSPHPSDGLFGAACAALDRPARGQGTAKKGGYTAGAGSAMSPHRLKEIERLKNERTTGELPA